MLRLCRENLRYHWGVLAVTVALSLVPAMVVGVVLLTSGATAEPVVVSLLFSAVVGAGVASFVVIGRDASEHRPALHLLLAVPVRAVALSRVLGPVVVMLVGSGAALLLAVSSFALLEPARYRRLLDVLPFVAAQLGFIGQVVLGVQEVLAARRDRRSQVWPAILAGLLVLFGLFAWIEVYAKWPAHLKTAAVLAETTLAAVANLAAFETRRSFVR